MDTDISVGGQCVKGTFCPNGTSHMLGCLPGFYCDRAALVQPSGTCAAGYYCRFNATSAFPENSERGGVCPAGHYCAAASSSPIPCPSGTSSPFTGKTNVTTCRLCTAGMYCNSTGLAHPSGLCAAGFYCPAGQNVPNPNSFRCPVGRYCPPGSVEPLTCPQGTFQDETGASACKNCTPGYYCRDETPSDLNTFPIPRDCPAGFYCPPGTTQPNQFPCPPGFEIILSPL